MSSSTSITNVTDNAAGVTNKYQFLASANWTVFGVSFRSVVGLNIRGGPTTISVTLSASDTSSLIGDEFSGNLGLVDNSIGVFDTNTGTSLSDNITLTYTADVLWSYIATDGATATAGSGYTLGANVPAATSWTEYKLSASSGVNAVTWTKSAGSANGSAITMVGLAAPVPTPARLGRLRTYSLPVILNR